MPASADRDEKIFEISRMNNLSSGGASMARDGSRRIRALAGGCGSLKRLDGALHRSPFMQRILGIATIMPEDAGRGEW
jgi:hypothetical protein